jgi:hypothetical protein
MMNTGARWWRKCVQHLKQRNLEYKNQGCNFVHTNIHTIFSYWVMKFSKVFILDNPVLHGVLKIFKPRNMELNSRSKFRPCVRSKGSYWRLVNPFCDFHYERSVHKYGLPQASTVDRTYALSILRTPHLAKAVTLPILLTLAFLYTKQVSPSTSRMKTDSTNTSSGELLFCKMSGNFSFRTYRISEVRS